VGSRHWQAGVRRRLGAGGCQGCAERFELLAGWRWGFDIVGSESIALEWSGQVRREWVRNAGYLAHDGGDGTMTIVLRKPVACRNPLGRQGLFGVSFALHKVRVCWR